jgi:hypothetical protein
MTADLVIRFDGDQCQFIKCGPLDITKS